MFLKGELFFIVGIFIDDETIDDNIRMNKILLKTSIILPHFSLLTLLPLL